MSERLKRKRRDLMEQKRLAAEREKDVWQQQMVQSHKMELVGQLAGGIAHDFNNILTGIIGYANLSIMSQSGDRRMEYTQNIIDLANRAAHLTQSLLAFSRTQPYMPMNADLNIIVSSMEKILWRLTGEKIKLSINTSPDPINVHVDENQIDQVIMNLIVNAVQAMPLGGEIALRTTVRTISADEAKKLETPSEGDFAVIEVADTGGGILQENIGRIFEPFFTTKEVGEGSGLGLSVAYGITESHGGFILVDSRPGKGSAFSVHLPLGHQTTSERPGHSDSPPQGGTETILIADDSDEILQIATYILGDFGYSVLSARDGTEALDLFLHDPEGIDLLLLDFAMPNMGGLEVYDAISAEHPGVKCILMSGYMKPEQIIESEKKGISLIGKPISPKEILLKIREVLDHE